MASADLPTPFDVDHLRRRAKEFRRAVLAGDRLARERARKAHPRFGTARLTDADIGAFTLRDAQLCLARELGFDGWQAVLAHVQGTPSDRPWRRWPDQPDLALSQRAIDVARAAGRVAVGRDEALGALVRPPADGPAATVLGEMGLTWDAWLAVHGRPAAEGRTDLRFNPGWHGLVGFASGIALAAGATDVGDEHVLLALAYQRTSRHPYNPLDRHGIDAEAVVVALARRGIAASDLRPPARAADERGPGPRVYFPTEEFRAVVDAIDRRHPGGSGYWGFNVDLDGRHYVVGEADLGLEAIVRRAVADPDTVTVTPPGGG
jgi:hypothetical protein